MKASHILHVVMAEGEAPHMVTGLTRKGLKAEQAKFEQAGYKAEQAKAKAKNVRKRSQYDIWVPCETGKAPLQKGGGWWTLVEAKAELKRLKVVAPLVFEQAFYKKRHQ